MSNATTNDKDAGPDSTATWTVRVLGRSLAGLLTLAALLEAGSVDELFDYAPYPEARLLVYLGIGIATLFILKPAGRDERRRRVPLYDGLIALVGTGVCFYAAWHYERLFESMADSPPDAVAIGGIVIAIVGEGLRRTAGNILPIFTLNLLHGIIKLLLLALHSLFLLLLTSNLILILLLFYLAFKILQLLHRRMFFNKTVSHFPLIRIHFIKDSRILIIS